MRKLLLALICLLALTMNAQQKCAVMDFDFGSGISKEQIDGTSEMFMSYFKPNGYEMIERAQIDKVLREHNFQRIGLTDNQKVQVGKFLNASLIVVGKVSTLGGKYQVDVRIVDVQTSHDVVSEGETFIGDYRTNMKNLAQRLANQVQALTSTQANMKPYVIYGYLKVFPVDLGSFDTQPKQIIKRLNQSQIYGYGTWRLPTNEELQLMRTANVIGNDGYMTKEYQKGIVRLVTDLEIGDVNPHTPDGYVDLGLPSGTLWKDKNEEGEYSSHQAIAKYGSLIPTKEQFIELARTCRWFFDREYCKVIGPNDNFIILPYNIVQQQYYNTWYSHAGHYVSSSGYYLWFLDNPEIKTGSLDTQHAVRLVY